VDTNRSINPQSVVSDPFTVTFIRIKAKQLCRRTDVSRSDLEDLQQEMRQYLLEKAHLFDPERGNVEAFVTNAINTWVAIYLRRQDREKRRDAHKAASLERTHVECNGDVRPLGETILEEEAHRRLQTEFRSDIEQFELREDVQHVLAALSQDERDLLAHVAEHGMTSAARARGTSRRQIRNAMARIRHAFEKAGLGSEGADRAVAGGIGNP